MTQVLHGDGELDHEYVASGAGSPTRTWSKVQPDLVPKAVCGECNHGWMADLEARARPRLAGLIGGAPRSLSRVDGEVIARWGAKTTLMFQALEPEPSRVVPRELYAPFKSAAVLPPTMRVWAAKVQARGVFQRAFSATVAFQGVPAPMFTSLVTFDRLALMVMGCRHCQLMRGADLGVLGNAWVELGTERAARWPPPFAFSVEQFGAMPELIEATVTLPPAGR